VLSHHSGQHLQNLIRAHAPAFYQAYYHSQISSHARIKVGFTCNHVPSGLPLPIDQIRFCLASLPVLYLFLELAFFRFVVLRAALRRMPLAVRIFAPKGTSQVFAPGVAWMGQEKYPAMPTASQTSPHVGLCSKNGLQDNVVLQHEISCCTFSIPTGLKMEMSLDSYSKKAKFSLMMLM
jgi:hypothetical protein